jgi:hypothetical protein
MESTDWRRDECDREELSRIFGEEDGQATWQRLVKEDDPEVEEREKCATNPTMGLPRVDLAQMDK